MMKRIPAFFVCSLLAILASCTWVNVYNSRNLGGGYYLLDKNRTNVVFYSTNNDSTTTHGFVVIDKRVVAYNSDDNFIIIKTNTRVDANTTVNEFWSIDKRQPINLNLSNWQERVLTGPLDSTAFYEYLALRKIHLQFVGSKRF